MKRSLSLSHLTLPLIALLLVSCSEHWDDEEYRSLPPSFADMELRMLSGETTLTAGADIVATAVQSTTGRLIYRATYSWELSPLDVEHRAKDGVVYNGCDESNPTDTFRVASPGVYTLRFKGRYYTTGQYDASHVYSFDITDGSGKCTAPSFQYYEVEMSRRIIIQ